jgi:hypothetical protein
MPAMLDAANVVAQRRGDAFIQEFGAAMTGVAPKTTFLKPGVALPLAVELARQLIFSSGPRDERYLGALHADPQRASSFRNTCLLTADS